jgi:ABC-type antimicrobial peptide transport system permease subunit
LRAIGLQRSQVLVMFLLEALILCVGGVFAGILVGLTTAGIINAAKFTIEKEAFQMFLMSNRMELAVQPGDLMLTFGMLSFILVVVALFPAYRASKMKPVTAIQYVST